ncbi:MAG: hypothetical protein AAB691_04280 [Patescibacteria group bacterium]
MKKWIFDHALLLMIVFAVVLFGGILITLDHVNRDRDPEQIIKSSNRHPL